MSQRKPKPRKDAPKPPAPRLQAPAPPAPPHSPPCQGGDEGGVEVQVPAARSGESSHLGTGAKARSPAPRRRRTPARELVRTLDERLKELAELPSLKAAPQDEAATPPVDPLAAPPPAPPLPVEPEGAPYLDRGAPIPDSYGMERVVVLPRDPHWAFVYWELNSGTPARLRTQHGETMPEHPRWVLRVQALQRPACGAAAETSSGPYLVDVDVQARQWYLKVAPDTRLAVDLGFVNTRGEFACVLQGNPTSTPRPAPSEVGDERWWVMRPELEQLLRAGAAGAGIPAAAGASAEGAPRFFRSEQPRAAPLFSSYALHLGKKGRT